MKSVLILIFLSGISTSRPAYFERVLDSSTRNSEDEMKRQLAYRTFSRQRSVSAMNNLHHRRNQAYYTKMKDYLNQRFLHPHMYVHSLRYSNPSFRQQIFEEKRDDSSRISKYKHNNRFLKRAPDATTYLNYQSHSRKNNLGHRPGSLNSRNNQNNFDMASKNPYGSANEVQQHAQQREITKDGEIFSDDSRKSLISNLDDSMSKKANGAFKNEHSSTTLGSLTKDNKRDVPKTKRSGLSPVKRLYQSLGRFDLLYLLGLFLIFIPIASITIVILPLASFCWNNCKKQKMKHDIKPSSNEVTVETAFMNEPYLNVKHATKCDSYKDMYKSFVSNEIDGEGDTLAKRMKLERWMTQSKPDEQKPKFRPRFNRFLNSAQMEKVEEEPSDYVNSIAVASRKTNPYEKYETESGETSDKQDESQESPERDTGFDKRRGGNSMREDKTATQQKSGPFTVAPSKVTTTAKVHVPREINPRHTFSLLDYSSRLPKRTSYSMVDINPSPN